jgi:hypothetical protein
MVTMMFWYGSGGWAWWQAGLMWLVMIAFWAFLIWAVYALVTGVTRKPGQPHGGGQQPGGHGGLAVRRDDVGTG